MNHQGQGNDSDVLSFSGNPGLAYGHLVWFFGDRTGNTEDHVREIVEELVFQEDHWILVLDRGKEEALSVVWCGGDHDLHAWEVRESSVEALGVLSSVAVSTTYGPAQHHGNGDLAATHVMDFRHLIVDLIEAYAEEVRKLKLDDRSPARHGQADGRPHEGGLRDRCVSDPFRPEGFKKPLGHGKGASEGADILPDEDDLLIRLHGLG